MTGLAVLRPTATRLIFLVEWFLFILLALWQGKLESGKQTLVASYPLAFFYAIACAFALLSEQSQQLARGWRLFALAVGLTAVDQLAKALIVASIPYQASVPVIDGWLHLAHARNARGSWLLSTLSARELGIVLLTMGSFPSIKGQKKQLSPLPGEPPDLLDPPPDCRFHPRCSYATDRCALEAPPFKECR